MAMASSKPTDNSNLMVGILVLTNIEKRVGEDGTYGLGKCIDQVTKTIKTLYVTEKNIHKVERNKYYLLINAAIGTSINIKYNTKVLEGKPFEHDESIVRDFLNPKVVPVQEALVSPTKRVSITGIVQGTTQIFCTEKSRRKLVLLRPVEEETPILTVKLWGQKTELDIPPKDTLVIVTDIEMKQYNGQTEGNSTETTDIQIEDDDESIDGEIEGACFDSGSMCMVINRKQYHCSKDIITTAFPNLVYNAYVKVHATVKGCRIISLERTSEERDAKKFKNE